MNIAGTTIDTRAIAAGLYGMMSENDRAVVAFGMIPKDWVDRLECNLDRKFEDMAKDAAERVYGFRPKTDCAKKDMKAEFLRGVIHQVSIDLLGVAKEHRALLV